MVKRKSLKEIHHEIRNEIISLLEAHKDLREVKDIVYGERQRIGRLLSPAIWIIPEPYDVGLRGGRTAQHDITFNFIVLVKDNEPERGLQKAQDLAFTVYDVLVEDRTLNGLVSDVRPQIVDPSHEAGENTQLYWSAVQFVFRLQRRE